MSPYFSPYFSLAFCGRIHLALFLIVCNIADARAQDVLPVKTLQERQLAFNRLRGISTRSYPLYFYRDRSKALEVTVKLFADRLNPVKVTTRDPKVIGRVHNGVNRALTRTSRIGDAIPQEAAFGEMELKFERWSTRVLFTDTFVVEIAGRFTDNGGFVSAPLATAVDKILKEGDHSGLTGRQLEGLSGVLHRRNEQQQYFDDQFGEKRLFFRNRKDALLRQESDTSKHKPLDFGEPSQDCESLKWSGLDFLMRNRLDKITVRLGDLNTSFLPPGPAWLRVEVTDVLTLRRAARGIRETWKSLPAPGIAFGQLSHGKIDFYADGRIVPVYINAGFFFIEDAPITNYSFRSWTLAKVLNDILLRETGVGMRKDEFETCAGTAAFGVSEPYDRLRPVFPKSQNHR